MRTIFLSAAMATTLSCASVPAPTPASRPPSTDPPITAMAVSRDRATLWYAVGSERCDVRALAIEARTERTAFSLDGCPTSITVLDDESLVLADGVRFGAWKRPDGADMISGSEIVAVADATNHVLARGDRIIWKRGEIEIDLGSRASVRQVRVLPVAGELVVVRRTAEGERITRVTGSGENDVSTVFSAIDSIDVAPRGDEIVFSARREKGFDVAIASTDGKTVNWIAPDPADEVGVTWAPRGNKVSFLIRGVDSTLARSVHVPTAFQLTFDTPFMSIRKLAWEPRAERFAMSLDGPTASPHIDWIEYGGTGRETLVAPRELIAREPERLALGSETALLLPPATIRYGEKLPLLVRLTDEPLAWTPDLRDLDSFGGGILFVPADSWKTGDPLAPLLKELEWVDLDEIVVIDPTAALDAATPGLTKGQTLLTLGTKQGPGRFFSERALSDGVLAVSAEHWQGAMEYLRGRFKTKR